MRVLLVVLMTVFLSACFGMPDCEENYAKRKIQEMLIQPILDYRNVDNIDVSFTDIKETHLTQKGDRYCYARMHLHADGETTSIPISYSFFEDANGEDTISISVDQSANFQEIIVWNVLKSTLDEATSK